MMIEIIRAIIIVFTCLFVVFPAVRRTISERLNPDHQPENGRFQPLWIEALICVTNIAFWLAIEFAVQTLI